MIREKVHVSLLEVISNGMMVVSDDTVPPALGATPALVPSESCLESELSTLPALPSLLSMSDLPGCLCLARDSCSHCVTAEPAQISQSGNVPQGMRKVSCVSSSNTVCVSSNSVPLDKYWDHLVAIKKLTFSKPNVPAQKRKEGPVCDLSASLGMMKIGKDGDTDVVDAFKKMKLVGNDCSNPFKSKGYHVQSADARQAKDCSAVCSAGNDGRLPKPIICQAKSSASCNSPADSSMVEPLIAPNLDA